MTFNFGSQTPSAQQNRLLPSMQTSGFGFQASSSPAPNFGFGGFGASSAAASTPLFGATSSAFGFGQQQSQPSLFGSSQQQQSQQQQNQLTIFGASSQQQQQQQPSSFVGSFPLQPQQQQQQQQPQGPLSAYAAAQMAPASQEIVAIAQAFSKDSDQYPFRHLFLNVVDDPRRYGRPRGVTDLEWREAVQRAGGPNNADKLWPVLLRGFDELVTRRNTQDAILKEHRLRLENAVEMAAKLQRNEDTLLRGKMDAIKQRHAELSGRLLQVVHAVDGLEGRFAEASHYHNSRSHQMHAALGQDLAQLEASLAPNSAVGLKSRAEALKAASTMQTTGLTSAHMQPLNQHDLDSIQQLLTQNQRVLTKLQEVLRKDNRDCAILSQSNNDLMLLTP